MRENRGYKKLVVWQNTKKLRRLVYSITEDFPKSEYRRISQMRDAARSSKQNIQEGYKRGTIGAYIQALRISKGSLAELEGDIEDCFEDKLINREEYKKLMEICGKTDYLFNRLIDSLEKKRREGTWKDYS